jgi:hypothetical protein
MDTQSKVIGLFVTSLTRGFNSETTTTTDAIIIIIIMSARALSHYGLSCQVVFSAILGVLIYLVSTWQLCPAFGSM